MKPQDLRIGSIVNYYGDDFPQGEVCTIDAEDLILMRKNPVYLSEHKPIKITEEWLEKLGFKEDYRSVVRILYTHQLHSNIGYDFRKEGTGHAHGFRYFGHHIREIIYIHQLQNLFHALIGEELIFNK